MIDYDKLNIARTIAQESNRYHVGYFFGVGGVDSFNLYDRAGGPCIFFTENIDGLITKLRELTQPAEPGYISETLEEIFPVGNAISGGAGNYRIINGRWFKVIEKFDRPIWIISNNSVIKTTESELPTKYPSHDSGYWTTEKEAQEKLRQSTQPEPKYKVNQEVFTRDDQEIHCFAIDSIVKDGGYYYIDRNEDGDYGDKSGSFDQYEEDELYPTKAALIEAQIEYWFSLKEQPKEPEYCNVSGAKQGKREECLHPETTGSPFGINFICTVCGESGLKRPDEYQPPFKGAIKGFSTKPVTQKSCDESVTESGYKWTNQDWVDDKCPRSYIGTTKKLEHPQAKLCQACENNPRFDCSKDYVCDHYEGKELQSLKKDCPYDPDGCPTCTPKECQHENDGHSYVSGNILAVVGFIFKCTKCGEFY